MSRQAANTLGTHRVALVCHRGRPNLCRLEWFLNLLQVRKQAEICSNFVRSRTEAGERRKDVDVDLARVGLRSDGVGISEAAKFGDELVELFDLDIYGLDTRYKRRYARNLPYRGHHQTGRGSLLGYQWYL